MNERTEGRNDRWLFDGRRTPRCSRCPFLRDRAPFHPTHPHRYLLRRGGGGGTGPSASHEGREFSISLGINIPAASVDRKVRGTYGPRENRRCPPPPPHCTLKTWHEENRKGAKELKMKEDKRKKERENRGRRHEMKSKPGLEDKRAPEESSQGETRRAVSGSFDPRVF